MQPTPLRRAATGAVLGGVCAGLARRWQVDPTVLRIAMVLLALIGGIGVAFYVGAVLLIPKDGSTQLPLHRIAPFTASWPPAASIGAVVGLGALITVVIGSWLPFGIPAAIGLGFLWYFGFYRRRPAMPNQPDAGQLGAPPPVDTSSMTDFERAAAEWQRRVAEEQLARRSAPSAAQPPSRPLTPEPQHQRAQTRPEPAPPVVTPHLVEYRPTTVASAPQADAQPPAAVPNWTPPAGRVRRRAPRWLWLAVIGLIGAGVGILAAVDSVTAIEVPPVAFAGVVLGAMGVGLLTGAILGRPRGLLPLGVVAGLVTVALLIPHQVMSTAEDQTLTYATMAEIPLTQRHGVGDVSLDLSGVTVSQTGRYEVITGVGDLTVKLPATGNVVVDWQIGVGDYFGPDGTRESIGSEQSTYRRVTDPSRPILTLVLQTGVGDLRVTQ